jgi:hypothetical protein
MNPAEQPTPLTATEFTDRVMSAIVLLPAPTPTRTFLTSIRTGALSEAISTLWVAWHLGTVRSWSVAPRVRARSFALVLAVTAVLASGSIAAAAVVHSVVPHRDDRDPVAAPGGPSVDEGPTGSGRTSSEPSRHGTESPVPSVAPRPSEYHAVPTTHAPAAPGHHATDGGQTKATDDHHVTDDEHATDDRGGPGDGGDAHDGSGGGDQPAATDDHGGAAPSETGAPEDHAATDGGSSGSGDGSGGAGQPDSGSDSSGG